MLEILPSPDHVVAFRVTGTMTPQDFDRSIAAVEAALGRHRRIGMYAEMTGFTDLTAETLGKDLRYSFGHIGEWNRFPRSAVVTDKQWLKFWVRTMGAIIPGVEARAYDPGEEQTAMTWAAGVTPD